MSQLQSTAPVVSTDNKSNTVYCRLQDDDGNWYEFEYINSQTKPQLIINDETIQPLTLEQAKQSPDTLDNWQKYRGTNELMRGVYARLIGQDDVPYNNGEGIFMSVADALVTRMLNGQQVPTEILFNDNGYIRVSRDFINSGDMRAFDPTLLFKC